MKYMIMMFGDAAAMGEVQSPEWIREMIGDMIAIDKDLTDSGELVFQAGLDRQLDGEDDALRRRRPGRRDRRPVRRVEGVAHRLLDRRRRVG